MCVAHLSKEALYRAQQSWTSGSYRRKSLVYHGLCIENGQMFFLENLYETLKETMNLDFKTYRCGHSTQEYQKEKLLSHMRNIENLKVDRCTKQDILGFETYCSKYEDACGKSEIIFTIDKLEKTIGGE